MLCTPHSLWSPHPPRTPPTARLRATFRPSQDVVQAIRAPLAERGGVFGSGLRQIYDGGGPRTSDPLHDGPLRGSSTDSVNGCAR